MNIRVDDLTGEPIIALIKEHLTDMLNGTPIESVHALDLDKLRKPEITFWSAWDGEHLMGCGAMKELEAGHGEIKSMRTVKAHLRKGVAKQLLVHIVEEAKSRGYRRISLETGSQTSFEPARKLYESVGFRYCGPFADYVEDPYSAYMTLEL